MMKKVLLALLLAVMAVALYAWIYQLNNGLGVTGMNRPVTWGLYIVVFVFFVGVSAGGIAVASLSHLAGIEKFKSISRVSEVLAIISLLLAVSGIFLDLGRPDRFLNLIRMAQFSSPIIWDVIVINTYLVLCGLMLFLSLKGYKKLLKIVALLSIPAFVLVHSVTAWIFGLMKSQPGWHTSILAPLFIVSALVSGLALIILALLFSRRFLNVQLDDEVIVGLGKYFKFLFPVLFYFLFCEFITIVYPAIPSHLAVSQEIFFGKFARVFWFDILVGIIIPFFVIISRLGATAPGVGAAALLSFVGVFAERINIVLPSLYHPLLGSDRLLYSYSPTWVEYSIVAGLLAFGVVLFVVAEKILPLFDEVKI